MRSSGGASARRRTATRPGEESGSPARRSGTGGGLRICYLSASTVPSRTANSVHVMKMCGALAELGHDVTLFARTAKADGDPFAFYEVEPRFRLRDTPKKKGIVRGALFGWRVRRSVNALRPDLIYSRNLKIMTAVGRLGVPFVFDAHDLLPDRIKRFSQLFEMDGFRRLVVNCRALKDDFLAEFPSLDCAKVVVAQNGASPPPRRAVAPPDGCRFRVGYLGALYPGKGMEVVCRLAERCPWAEFRVVGGVEEDIDHWRAKLAALPNVRLCGFVPHHETAAHVASFDVALAPYQPQMGVYGGGVLPTRWTSPLKIFQYMAHGKAIVASDLPAMTEVLEDGRSALLVPPADVDAWVRALGRLRDDPSLRERLGRSALEDFEARYTWRRRAETVLKGL